MPTPRKTTLITLTTLTLLIAGYFFLWSDPQEAGAAWWNSSWSYRKALTVDSSKVIANLTDYPMLVSINDSDLATHAQENGNDIVFTDSNDIKLSHEIESYSSSTGELIAWVKIPSLSSSTDTQLFIYYGNNSASNQEDTANVWNSSYSAVWHMTGSSNGGENDSTSNGNNLSNSGSVGASNEQIIGPSREISTNGNNFLYIADNSTLDNTEELTIQAWARDTQGDTSPRGLVSKRTNSTTDLAYSAYLYSGRYYWFDVGAIDGGTVGMDQLSTNSTTATQNDWQLLHFVMDGSENDAFAYVDGSLASSDSNFNLSTINDRSSMLHIGILNNGYSYSWLGQFDEVRIIKDALTPGWIETEHNNQSSPDTFVSFSSQVSYVDFLGVDEFWPVGHWSFDEGYGSTAHNESILGGDGVINGAAWKSEEECIAGKCLFFDGVDDYIDIAQVVDDYPVTMSAWVKSNKDDSIGTPLFIGPEFENDGLAILFDDDTNIYMTANGTTVNGVPYEENKWYYVSVVYTSSTERSLYVDGSLILTEVADRTPSSFENVWIGRRYNWGVYDYFSGYIDEVKVYNYPRTADQIKQDYNVGLAGQSTAKGTSASFGSVSEKWMSDGLVGYWKLDEAATSSGAIDSSSSENDGVYNGHASTTVGKYGSSGVFDGTGYILISDNQILDSPGQNNELTICSWFKVDNHQTGDRGVVGKWVNSGNNRAYLLSKTDASNQYCFYLSSDGSWNPGVTVSESCTNENLNTGQWYNLCGVFDGLKARLYLNSVLQDDIESLSGIYSGSSADLEIGSFNIGTGNFDGNIDEVRIYNRALSPSEVQKLYEWAPGPLVHLKMDELNGDTAYDASENSNDGSIIEATWTRGKYGGALNFDGDDDRVNLGSDAMLDSLQQLTVCSWVNKQECDETYGIFASKSGTGYNGWNFYVHCSDSKGVGFSYWDTNSYGIWRHNYYQGLQFDQWHYLCASYDGSRLASGIKIYLNGIEISYDGSRQDVEFIENDASNNLLIGSTSNGGNAFGGYLDDLKIYNYVRSPKQILEDMNAGQAIKNPVLDLGFDKGREATVYDRSIQKNHGSLENGGAGSNPTVSSMWSQFGVTNGGIELDGTDDFINIPESGNSLNFTATDPFTFSTWIKTSDTGRGIIIGDWNGSRSTNFELHDTLNGNLRVYLTDQTDGSGSLDVRLMHSIADGDWHHVLFTYDGSGSASGIKIYEDGEVQTDRVISADLGPTGSFNNEDGDTLKIGKDNRATPLSFNGYIDELKIWRYALSAEEVKKIYNKSQAGVIGDDTSRDNNGTAVNGRSKKYCIPGDTAACDPPVLELKMDEMSGTTAYDTSGGGNDGSIYGATWDSLGKKGSALTFNGTDNDIRDIPNVDIQGNFTISAWIKPQTLTGERNIYYSLGDFFVEQRDDALAWRRVGSGCLVDGVGVDTSLIDSPSVLSIDKWQYATFVSDASNNKIYIYYNGRKVLDEDGKSDCPNSGFGARVGSTLSRYFDGSIDDFVIYDYARTPAQIAWDYNRGKPIAHWSFDECSGSTIHDESVNGNHGTLHLGTSGITATGTCAESGSSFWYNGKDGKINSSASFDGEDDYVEAADPSITDQLTISLWAKSNSSTVVYDHLVSYYPGFFIAGNSSNSNIRFVVNSGSETAVTFDVGPDDVTDWHNYIAVYNGSQMKVYLDGELKNTVSKSGDILTTGNFNIGSYWGDHSANYAWDGLIDEVKLWSYALTSEQVKTEYNGGAVRFE